MYPILAAVVLSLTTLGLSPLSPVSIGKCPASACMSYVNDRRQVKYVLVIRVSLNDQHDTCLAKKVHRAYQLGLHSVDDVKLIVDSTRSSRGGSGGIETRNV